MRVCSASLPSPLRGRGVGGEGACVCVGAQCNLSSPLTPNPSPPQGRGTSRTDSSAERPSLPTAPERRTPVAAFPGSRLPTCCRRAGLGLAVLRVVPAWAGDDKVKPTQKDGKPLDAKVKEIAGSAEFLRSVPKHFATLQAVDAAGGRVTLLLEGETLA